MTDPRPPAERRLHAIATQLQKGPLAPDVAAILQELEVYQHELDLQTQELARQQAETETALRRYQDLYESAPVGYFTVDRLGAIHAVNLTGAALLRRDRQAILGQRLGWYLAPSDRDACARLLDALFATGARQSAGFALAGDTGPIRWVEIEAVPDNEPARARVAMTDVTERRSLRLHADRTARLEGLGLLAGGIAHHFNNLLTVTMGGTDLAMQELPPDSPALASLQDVFEALKQTATLTAQLLAFARGRPPAGQATDLTAVLHEMAPLLRLLAGATAALELGPGAGPAGVGLDRAQIAAILTQLVINGRDAMPGGGALGVIVGRTTIEAPGPLRPGPYVTLVVRDAGGGMDARAQERLFDPFYTTKGPGGGLGLGLATIYGMVTRAGGDVRVDSVPGHGTTIEVLLPELPVEGT